MPISSNALPFRLWKRKFGVVSFATKTSMYPSPSKSATETPMPLPRCFAIPVSCDTAAKVPHPLVSRPQMGGRYTVDFEALEAAVTPRTRLLLYTSPSNPLGWVASDTEQQGLLDFARRHGL